MIPQFDDSTAYMIDLRVQRQLIIGSVVKKLNEGDHPWATAKETHLLDVMAGATLIALRLACKGSGLKYPDDVFQEIPYEELEATVDEVEQSWADARARHAAKKYEAIRSLQEQRKPSGTQDGGGSSCDPDPSMDKGGCLVLSSASFSIISSDRSGKWWE